MWRNLECTIINIFLIVGVVLGVAGAVYPEAKERSAQVMQHNATMFKSDVIDPIANKINELNKIGEHHCENCILLLP